MTYTRRSFFQAMAALPVGTSLAHFQALAAPARDQFRITAIKAMQVKDPGTMIRIETDAGMVGYGPCHGSGPFAREVIRQVQGDLIGKDPLAIQVHFHNLFYARGLRPPQVPVFSGIDIALWDLAGNILGRPVSKLLGGNFREEILLYSHCPHSGNFWDRAAWRDRSQTLKDDPNGYTAYKIDISDALGVPSGQYLPAIGPQEAEKVRVCYALARETLGPSIDIIVHCHTELDLPSAIQVAEAVEPVKPLWLEDPLQPAYSDSWMALRRTTRVPITTGEAIELLEGALPFLQHQAVDYLQPDLLQSGGITAVKMIADLAGAYRIPICLHNVSGLLLDMASQQFSAATFNCPRLECVRGVNHPRAAASNAPVVKNGRMLVSTLPGLGLDLNQDYLRSNLAPGEPWWG